MVTRNVCGIFAVIMVLATGMSAQPSAAPAKTKEGGSPAANSVQTPAPASGQNVVLRIGSTEVTQAEIDSIVSRLNPKAKMVIATEGRGPVADEFIRTLLLSQRATEQHLDQSPEIRQELEMQREQILAQAEYQKIVSDHPVSEEEIKQYFAAHQSEFETVQFSEFLVRKRPADKDGSDPLQGLPLEQAKATAEKIRRALLAGKTADEVAQTYSQTSGVMLLDPKPRTSRRADMKPVLEKAAFQLPDGGVSEVVDTPQAFIVVKVLVHKHPELKDVSSEITTKLQRERLDAEVETLKKKADIWMDQEYFKAPEESASALAGRQTTPPKPQPRP
jgi:parvulin-like peptidyl-prolyl isomerase